MVWDETTSKYNGSLYSPDTEGYTVIFTIFLKQIINWHIASLANNKLNAFILTIICKFSTIFALNAVTNETVLRRWLALYIHYLHSKKHFATQSFCEQNITSYNMWLNSSLITVTFYITPLLRCSLYSFYRNVYLSLKSFKMLFIRHFNSGF